MKAPVLAFTNARRAPSALPPIADKAITLLRVRPKLGAVVERLLDRYLAECDYYRASRRQPLTLEDRIAHLRATRPNAVIVIERLVDDLLAEEIEKGGA